jgi:hypothetical protein
VGFTFPFPLILSTILYRHQSKILVQYSPDFSEPFASIHFNKIVSTFRDSFRRMWMTSSRCSGRCPITPSTARTSLRRNKPVFSLSKFDYIGRLSNATGLCSFHVSCFPLQICILLKINVHALYSLVILCLSLSSW